MYEDKLTIEYIKNGFRKYLPEELVPKGICLIEWMYRLRKWVRKEKENGYSNDYISRCIDRHIELAAQLRIEEREA